MNLPELPRQLKTKEAKSSVVFRHWLEKNPWITCALEMKDTRGKSSLAFNEVSPAQIAYGMAIKHNDKGVLIRVQAIIEGMPDYIYLRKEPAVIPIKYPQGFAIIDVETFLLESKRSKRRSLTWARAKELSIKTI